MPIWKLICKWLELEMPGNKEETEGFVKPRSVVTSTFQGS